MSTPDTGAAQRERLRELGLSVRDLPILRDVDTYEDALAVARLAAPQSAFASMMTVVAELLADKRGLAVSDR
jgi:glycosyltransferase A (GT-A) superfamily protein (DUF2064 family)